MYINPDLRDSIMIQSMDKIVKYNRLANYKNLSARDTRPLMSILANLPKFDRHLLSLIGFRRMGLAGYNYTIKFPDGFKTTDAEEKQLADIKRRFRMSKIYKTIPKIIGGKVAGMGAIEFDFTGYDDTNKHFAKGFKIYPITELDFDLNNDEQLRFVDTDTITQKFTRKDFNPATTMIIRDNPFDEYEQDYPGGLLRTNLVHIVLKYWDFFNWASMNEKYADPTRYALYEEKFEKKKAEILDNLAKMGTDTYGIFPKGVDIRTLDALREGAINSHKELEQSVNRGMSLSIVGQYSTFDGQAGSLAKSETGYKVSEDKILEDMVDVEHLISDSYLMQDYQLNYGEPKNDYPVLEYKKLFIHDREAHARMVSDYMSAGIPVSAKNVYDDIDFVNPYPDKEVIEPRGSIGG